MARSVVTPAGEPFVVSIDWLPRWRLLARRFGGWRTRRKDGKDGTRDGWLDALDVPTPFDLDDLVVGIALVLAFVGAVLLFWWFLLPLLLIVVDGLVLAGLLALGTLARVLLRRPWSVVVLQVQRDRVGGMPQPKDQRLMVPVVGLRRARRAQQAIADALVSGASGPVAAAGWRAA